MNKFTEDERKKRREDKRDQTKKQPRKDNKEKKTFLEKYNDIR
jgi:hypothetical protein